MIYCVEHNNKKQHPAGLCGWKGGGSMGVLTAWFMFISTLFALQHLWMGVYGCACVPTCKQ